MGPLRRRLTAALFATLPGPAFAQACATQRPFWEGEPVSAFAEAITLFSTPAALILLAASALAIRFRHQWAALVTCLLWSLLTSSLTVMDVTGGARDAAIAEGCIGSPALFIAVVAAICVGMILYTAPRPSRAQ
ncbi:hypothetical protein [Actibacterium sp. XHP0104]|uniref:hypothetical protein n=1 Tax=Actibacterium sp. XHP0104 TaxID=2984335 RepID=UPI0021E91926|nr:hypothetical protein [Actibacterium sp. XHP0104]MCV2882838.1 hypothetical protein [Actibacterium sp. XHP0104]